MCTLIDDNGVRIFWRLLLRLAALVTLVGALAAPAAAQDAIYFPAIQDVGATLVEKISAETVRIDMSVALLNDRRISQAVVNRFRAGVPVRLVGDRFSLFEIDPTTRDEFYWLANQGVPIRVRYNPTWYPEVAHWKATIFAGQGVVAFGSTNYTTAELAPSSSSNYTDGAVLITSDVELVNAFRTQFDRMWNDTAREVGSRVGSAPYFLNWDEACAKEAACADYRTRYPNPAPMIVDTSRREGEHPTPADLLWAQGTAFNHRVVEEINRSSGVDVIVYRLTVDAIADALIARHQAGVPVRVLLEPEEYRNPRFPEFWITRANIDRLWAAGVPVKVRAHDGLTRMTTVITQHYATVASSNLTTEWQRDHNYFVSASGKPAIYNAIRDRFSAMWNNAAAFTTFAPEPPNAPALQSPAHGATGVSTNATLIWRRAPFAAFYDVYLGTSPSAMAKVAEVPARLVNDPPPTYSWKNPGPLQAFTTYYWRVVSRTYANRTSASSTWSFTTGELSTLNVTPTSVDVDARGGSGTLTVTARPGELWTASNSAPWLSLSPASGAGNGTIAFAAARNNGRATRSATVTVNDILVTFTQDGIGVPGPPSQLAAAMNRPFVTFTWQPPTSGGDPLRYQIEVSRTPTFDAPVAALTSNATPAHQMPGVRSGVYYARVSAVNEAGVGVPSATLHFEVPPEPPGPPQNLRWSVSGSNVSLTWEEGSTGGIPAGYIIEAGLRPGRTDVQLPHHSTSTAWGIGGVPVGVYYVRLRAANHLGISPPSQEVTVYVGVPPPPAAPVGLTAHVVGSNVTLSWTPGVHENGGPPTHFILEAGYAPNVMNIGAFPLGPHLAVGIPAVPPGTYYARVRAANSTGWSPPSEVITVVVR